MINSVNNSSLNNNTKFDSTLNPLSAEEMFKKSSSASDPNAEASKGASQETSANENMAQDDGNIVHGLFEGRFIPDADYVNSESEPYSEEDDDVSLLIGDEEEDDDGNSFYDGKASAITLSFENLAAQLGTSEKITKEQLFAYLQSLMTDASADTEKTSEIAFVKNLIAKFDTLSDGEDYITSFNKVDVNTEFLFNGSDDEVVSTVEFRV